MGRFITSDDAFKPSSILSEERMAETPRPLCHLACEDIDHYPFNVMGREFSLLYISCDTDSRTIKGCVNDWNEDRRFASLTIHLDNDTLYNTTIHTAIYRDLKQQIESRIRDSRIVGEIELYVSEPMRTVKV